MTDKQIDALFASDHFKKKLNEYILGNLKIEKKRGYFSGIITYYLKFADKVVDVDDTDLLGRFDYPENDE